MNDRLTEVETKLHYIITEVSANGNKGLEPSLRDIYQMSKLNNEMAQQNNAAILEMRAAIQPDLDRTAFWKAGRKMFQTSWFGKFFSSNTGRMFGVVGLFIFALPLLNAFGVPTAAIIKYVGELLIKVWHVYVP
ncbi:MAG: hypothetical protein WC666_04230 [Candidatus Paceibacterota bacterium]